MKDCPTLLDVIELAISAEREAESFYKGLVLLFAEYDDVADFWLGMMRDEQEHARCLELIRDSLDPAELASPESADAFVKVKNFLAFSTPALLANVKTLDDAYRAAMNLEFSEVNKLAELLMSRHIGGDGSREEALDNLKVHGEKVQKIPSLFGDTFARKLITANPEG